MSNPYMELDGVAFWKTAVARQRPLEIAQLAKPKKKVGPEERVATAGSCFAQHISRRLRNEGFNFLDVEPAPEMLSPENRQKFGYELYSARYGNVYTSSQLRQLVERMLGQFEPIEPVWLTNGRYYDPFRPSIEPNGFVSERELEDCRRTHLLAVRRMFETADLFVFTLGLTEAWRSKADGAVYPTCPGTQAGTFDAGKYEFVNLSVGEVLADLRQVFAKLRALNPEIRFLLTVSPVPLTATASGKHVLTATTYSKSVLRAVAGQLTDELDHVDYFPSYEMITAPVFGGAFFDESRRNVTSDGVDFVMRTFLREFCEEIAGKKETSELDERTKNRARKTEKRTARRHQKAKDMEEVYCDEKMLEWYAR